MHGAETRTRALSLRADTLKCCLYEDYHLSSRESNPQLIHSRDENNPYATPTQFDVVDVVVVAIIERLKGIIERMNKKELEYGYSRMLIHKYASSIVSGI